jgi:hypothetical protein
MGKQWFESLLSRSHASDGTDRKFWAELIHTYSETEFTYWRDRHYAFFGLAQVLENSSSQALTVGLWRSDMLQELTWRSHLPVPAGLMGIRWLPTWSWMYHYTIVHSPHHLGTVPMMHSYADIRAMPAHDSQPEKSNYRGSPSNHIILRAPVAKLRS